jgi:hypothetical protein
MTPDQTNKVFRQYGEIAAVLPDGSWSWWPKVPVNFPMCMVLVGHEGKIQQEADELYE